MSTVRLPRLLNSQMAEKKRLHPSSLGITFNLFSPHSATMRIPSGETTVSYRDWVELYTQKGSAGIFRVTGLDTSVGAEDHVRLSHGICVLADDAPVFPKNDDGGMDEIEGTVGNLLTRLWSMRGVTETPKYWRIGTVVETPIVKYSPGSDSLLQAVEKIIKKTDGYALSFNQAAFPWTLNVIKLSDSNPCEGRFSRNLDSVDISIDDSEHYTRVYLDDRDGHTDADTVSTWGVISYIMAVPEGATDASISAHVSDFLEAHKDPNISIECSGADLSAITGQDLDALNLGRLCRACLTDYGTTINERIVSCDVPDVFGDPQGVHISMRNKPENASSLIAEIERDRDSMRHHSTITSRRAGGAVRQSTENKTVLIETSETLVDTRERIRRAGIIIDGDLGLVEVLATEEIVNDTRERLSFAGISINGPAANIVAKVGVDEVISSINISPEEIVIQARRVDLRGFVDTEMLQSELSYIQDLFAREFGTFDLSATNISCSTLKVDGDAAKWWTSPSFITSIKLRGTSPYTVIDTQGIPHTTYAGYELYDKDSEHIVYLGSS